MSGIPIWKAPGFVRAELNEPRWAAAPQLAFENDVTGNEGLYRIMVDPTSSTLVVSFQAPTDLGSPSNADVIYFGFTTDGTVGAQAKAVAIQVNGTGASDPSDALVIQRNDYNAGAWTSLSGAPTWLKDASVWRNNVAGDAAWGVNFKVDLAAAGLSATSAFKVQLAMHKEDEVPPALSVNISTPDPGANALLAGTLLINNPANWANAVAINSGCVGGITIQGNQIGTTNVDMGNPAPNEVNTTAGAINQFYAKPTIPASIGLFPGLFQGKFHVANWGSIAAANAPWTPLNGGAQVANGIAPAANDSTIQFNCPANTATQTCGIATPAVAHQCVYVELSPAPGQIVPITKASAFANMWFKPLSEFATPAEISVKGLKKVFNNDLPRDVYVYIYPKNMPAQGSKQLYLPTDKMAATRRFAEAPPVPVRHPEGKPTGVVGGPIAAAGQPAVAKPKTPGAQPVLVAPKAGAVVPAKTAPARIDRQPVVLPLPQTGIGDLDLNPLQALGAVWPTFDVHVYYDSGKTVTIGGKTSKQLVPMYPFTSFHSHEGPLFGFSHSFQLANGAQFKELRPDVFLLSVPSEGVAHVVTKVTAHEQPDGGTGGPECPKPPPVEPHAHCGCRVAGDHGSSGAQWSLFGLGALAIALGQRRRSRRS
ncbi:MAG TPA: MYXO-CTERM sorting domain-containing protein [Polyangiaceae bacterium]|nr:MYXO-CTERM sorting domain-containing protein [Polyangiaceae bacterium]